MVTIQLLLALFLVAPPPSPATPPAATRPAELATELEALEKGDVAAKSAAVRRLLEKADPRALPYLLRVLREPDAKLRQLATVGIVTRYPKQAYQALAKLAAEKGGTIEEREAASYGLGYVADDRVPGLLLTLLAAPEERIRKGAAYSLRQIARPAAVQANNHVLGSGEPPSTAAVARARGILAGVLERYLSGAARGEEAQRFLRLCADAATARAIRERYLAGLDAAHREVGALVARVARANRGWLGRTRPPVARIRYTFEMENLVAETTKEFPVDFSIEELELIRYWGSGYSLDRGAKLELPLDLLVLFPDLAQPQLEAPPGGVPQGKGATPEQTMISYQLPPRAEVTAAMGAMNTSYWQRRVLTGVRARVRIERERAVPLAETVFDARGRTVASIRYSDYLVLGDGSWAPLGIAVDIPAGDGAQEPHMQYEMRYQLVSGVWLFAEGTASEITPQGTELRALAHASDVQVIALPEPQQGKPGGGGGR